MGFTVQFYQFSKRENSTARPAASSPHVTYDCILKESSGVLSPLLKLNLGIAGNPAIYNYAYIQTFTRYYYVREWTFENGLWCASLNIDPLATWKNEIGLNTSYVLRCSNRYNGDIRDDMYPTSAEYDIRESFPDSAWWTLTDNVTSGYWVVGILCKQGSVNKGGISYFAFDYGMFKVFCNHIFDDSLTYYDGANLGIAESLGKLIFNPFEYITSITWIPDLPGGSTSMAGFNVGFWVFDGACYLVPPASRLTYSTQIDIPKHPQSATRGDFLNGAPFSVYGLNLPRLGLIPLDPNIVNKANALGVSLSVDVITGVGRYTISVSKNQDSYTLGVYHTQIGVQIQLAQTGSLQTLSDVVGSLTGVVAKASTIPLGGIAGGASAIGDIFSTLDPHVEKTSSPNGYLGLTGAPQPYLQCIFRRVVDENNQENGRPLCERVQLSTIPGYILCQDGDISIPGTLEENQAVKRYLEGGFHYE